MLVVIAVELGVILIGMVGCIVAVVREGRKASERNLRLLALMDEELGVERAIADAATSTVELTEALEVEARETRKAVGG